MENSITAQHTERVPEMNVQFEVAKEGRDKITYRETDPLGVIGSLYVSRLACHFLWNGVPKKIQIEMTEVVENA